MTMRCYYKQLSKVVPSDSALIGFVTSGNFSLSRGKGYAIGAISLAKFLEIREQAHRCAWSTFRALFFFFFICGVLFFFSFLG